MKAYLSRIEAFRSMLPDELEIRFKLPARTFSMTNWTNT
jgi:hypothetical protein